jgi:hypothetical protein
MMKIELIEANVDQTLELRGLVKEGNEQQVRLLLYYLYVSVCIWNLMPFEDKMKAIKWSKILKDIFSLKNYLKKRKNKKAKEAIPSLLPSKEKEIKEKEQETHTLKRKKEKDEEEQPKKKVSEIRESYLCLNVDISG